MESEKATATKSLLEHGGDATVAAVVVEERHGGELRASSPTGPITLLQQFQQISGPNRYTALAAVAMGLSCTCVLSVVIPRNPDFFPTGPLTSVQMGFFSLCFTSIALRAAVMMDAWDDVTATFEKQVNAISEIALALLLFFVCDRTTLLPRREKVFDPDFFTLLVMCFFIAGFLTVRQVPKKPAPAAKPVPLPKPQVEDREETKKAQEDLSEKSSPQQLQQSKPSSEEVAMATANHPHGEVVAPPPSEKGLLMNRHQTDEWKGWMQMLFLWYHYFNNKSIYNEIRVFIAAYVWMTGFGNFTYYYNREDFSLHRFMSMMWRLNMFVILSCGLLRNEYMLYYICPLHTLFTLTVFAALFIGHQKNRVKSWINTKIAVSFVVCFILWDLNLSPQLYRAIFLPIGPLVAYHDPYREDRDIYSEWFFRSFLDHYVWIIGMMVAFAYPTMEAWLRRLDDAPAGAARTRALLTKAAVALVAVVAMYVHYVFVLSLPKKDYNPIHPYTSAIPLLAFLVLRNISHRVRGCYLGLFEWFGKITLETYIAQFHVWMGTTGINGSPHLVLRFLPGEYPMCDFVVGSVIMFFLSHRVAMATDVAKGVFIPPKASNRVLMINLLSLACLCVGFMGFHYVWNSLIFSR